MLRLERVSKFYSANGMVSTGFSKVDLSFDNGEFVAITGESGSGKSTLLNVISGLDSFEEGEMYILGQPTSGFSKEDLEEYRKKYIGNIFQTFNLINSYTVYQNVELVLLMSGYDKSVIPQKVKDIIGKVGLSDYEKTKASKLSGGQKQRVAIARALAKETPIIVADEPTGNLDSKSAAEIVELLHELSRDKLIIIVTHNYDQVEPYVTRKITMHDGRVSEDKRIGGAPVSFKGDAGNPDGTGSTDKRQAEAEQETQAEADERSVKAAGSGAKADNDSLAADGGAKAGEDNGHAGESSVKTAKADALSFGNMVRLGVRNTFNIPAKFLLLLTVFVFLCAGVIGQYASVMNINNLITGQGYNEFFANTDRNRIIVSREDKKVLTESDYNKLKTIANVDRIVKNDPMMDLVVSLQDDLESSQYYTMCQAEELAVYKDRITEGRLPKNSKEAVLLIPREGYAADVIDLMMGKSSWLFDDNSGTKFLKDKIKIVGYGYFTEEEEERLRHENMYYEAYLCVRDDTMAAIRKANLEKSCVQEIHFADLILTGNSGMGETSVLESDKVPEGEIYVPEDIGGLSESPLGKELKLVNKSLYFEDTFRFTVGAVYNKDNLQYYLGLDKFDEISGSIFVNPKDYNRIFDKGNFQSSILVKNEKLAEATRAEIEKAGYKAFYVHEGLISYYGGMEIIATTMYTIMLAGILLVLFFITYFITKLILKSRNVYFSTVRMLGATKQNCSGLLKTELFVVGNIAFFLCTALAVLLKTNVIQAGTLNQLMSYLSVKDFAILYIVMCLMYILLAARYARQLFKQTAMNAYKEEV